MRGLLFFFILLLLSWYAFSGYWYNCKIKDRCSETVAEVEPVKAEAKKTTKPLVKKETFTENPTPLNVTGYSFKTGQPKDNIYFSTDSATMAKPIIGNAITPYLKEITDHLVKNPKNKLQITGYYSNQEAVAFKGKNLGLERADNVKNYLINAGLSKDQIETKSLQNNNLKIYNNNVTGAINLSLKANENPKIAATKPPAKVTKAIEQETKTVYFKYNSSEIILTKELKEYVERLKLYLKQNAGKKVVVTGHTDSFGKREQNIKLGLGRANFVKQFLIKNGITQKQINADSKGPDKPIASNKSPEGRKQNRRVEITFN